MNTKPEPLHLADWCEILACTVDAYDAQAYRKAASELRRLYEENERLKTTPPAAPVQEFNKIRHSEQCIAAGFQVCDCGVESAAPVQKPYGYVSTHTSGLMHFNKTFHGVYTDTATEIVAVYTHPAPAAQRQWVGLDAADWFKWWRTATVLEHTQAEIDFSDFLLIAVAVQDVLREKNGGAK